MLCSSRIRYITRIEVINLLNDLTSAINRKATRNSKPRLGIGDLDFGFAYYRGKVIVIIEVEHSDVAQNCREWCPPDGSYVFLTD